MIYKNKINIYPRTSEGLFEVAYCKTDDDERKLLPREEIEKLITINNDLTYDIDIILPHKTRSTRNYNSYRTVMILANNSDPSVMPEFKKYIVDDIIKNNGFIDRSKFKIAIVDGPYSSTISKLININRQVATMFNSTCFSNHVTEMILGLAQASYDYNLTNGLEIDIMNFIINNIISYAIIVSNISDYENARYLYTFIGMAHAINTAKLLDIGVIYSNIYKYDND